MTHADRHAQYRAALTATERGWRVFPLVPDGKRPAVAQWEQRATEDRARIGRCWAAGAYNVGVACGPSRLVVVDLDVPKGPQDVPPDGCPDGVTDGTDALAALCEEHGQPYPLDTFTVATPSGGTHLYFTAPPDGPPLRNTSGRLGWKIDTRAGGGYVVAPGSTIGGAAYTVAHDVVPRPLPGWIVALLAPAPTPPPAGPLAHRQVRNASAYASAALRNETANVATAPEGSRNWTLTRAARALGRLVASSDLPRPVVEEALKEAGQRAGLPERDCTATITSALNWSITTNTTSARAA